MPKNVSCQDVELFGVYWCCGCCSHLSGTDVGVRIANAEISQILHSHSGQSENCKSCQFSNSVRKEYCLPRTVNTDRFQDGELFGVCGRGWMRIAKLIQHCIVSL